MTFKWPRNDFYSLMKWLKIDDGQAIGSRTRRKDSRTSRKRTRWCFQTFRHQTWLKNWLGWIEGCSWNCWRNRWGMTSSHVLVTYFGDILFFRIGKLTNWCVMVTRTTIGLLIMMNLSIWWSVFQFLNKTISDWPSNQMSVWTWIPPVLDFGLIRLKPVRSDSKSRNIQLLIYYILFIQISWRHKSTQVRIWWRHLRWWRHQHTCVSNSIPFIFFEMKNLQIFSFWPSFK